MIICECLHSVYIKHVLNTEFASKSNIALNEVPQAFIVALPPNTSGNIVVIFWNILTKSIEIKDEYNEWK